MVAAPRQALPGCQRIKARCLLSRRAEKRSGLRAVRGQSEDPSTLTAVLRPRKRQRRWVLAAVMVAGVGLFGCDSKATSEHHATVPALAGHPCHSTIGHVVSGFTGLSGSEGLRLECIHTRSHGDVWVGAQSITTPGCIYTTSQCLPKTTPTTAPTGGPPTLSTPSVCTPYGRNYRCHAGEPCPAPVSGTKDDLTTTGAHLVCTRTDTGTTGYTWRPTPTPST